MSSKRHLKIITELALGMFALGAVLHVAVPPKDDSARHPRLEEARPRPRLVAATLFGGPQREQIRGAIVDEDGFVYITGRSESPRLRTTRHAFQRRFGGGGMDAFVAKLSPDLKTIHWLSYFGGSGYDVGYGIALGPKGSIVIAGRSGSKDLPTTEGVVGRHYSGGDAKRPYFGGDAFVCSFSPDGSKINFCSYFGGSGNDFARHLAVDATTGRIALAGSTKSLDLPLGPQSFGRRRGGGAFDAFVAVLSPGARKLEVGAYLGGKKDDRAQGVGIVGRDVVVTGWTGSRTMTRLSGKGRPGATDVWVARISGSPPRLRASARFGGKGEDSPEQGSLRIAGKRLLVSGYRQSRKIAGPWLKVGPGGGVDAFLAILDRKKLKVRAALRVGGSRGETVFGPASVGKGGKIWFAGDTNSPDFPLSQGASEFPAKDPKQAFGVIASSDGKRILASWLFGGSRVDTARGCVATPLGGVIIYGQTTSPDFPVTPGASQMRLGGRIDGFLAHYR